MSIACTVCLTLVCVLILLQCIEKIHFVRSLSIQLPGSAASSPVREKIVPPLTPGSSKKAFMETLLTPSTNIQEQLYDKEKASDLFVQGHSEITISVSLLHFCLTEKLQS